MLAKCACLISLGKSVKGYNPLHLVPSSCCGKEGRSYRWTARIPPQHCFQWWGMRLLDGGAVRNREGEGRWPFKDNSCQPQC